MKIKIFHLDDAIKQIFGQITTRKMLKINLNRALNYFIFTFWEN